VCHSSDLLPDTFISHKYTGNEEMIQPILKYFYSGVAENHFINVLGKEQHIVSDRG